MKKQRLDLLLVEKGLVPSREKARALIMAGRVLVNDQRVEKPGHRVPTDALLRLKEGLEYVSRGGLKLEAALDAFGIHPRGMTVLDAGASTGGFTDVLLRRGAAKVIAVDVGYGQFAWSLRQDPRVILLERTNIRRLELDHLPVRPGAAVADLSFISLKLVLGKLAELIPGGGWVLPMVKPQFEAGRQWIGKHGVVRDETRIREVLDSLKDFAAGCGFEVMGEAESPIRGPKGNREFFLHLVKR